MGKRGEKHHAAKLTDGQVREIFLSEDAAKAVAYKHSVSVDIVYRIWQRHSWTHVTNDLKRPEKKE